MSELQAYYNSFRTGYWADENAEKCLCHGSGWALSDVDTTHQCPIHFKGQLPPEYAGEIEDENEYKAAEEASMAAWAAEQKWRQEQYHKQRAMYEKPLKPKADTELGPFDDDIPF